MSKTVLELTQDILEKTEDAEVNSITDAIQGLNAAGCLETVFNSIITERDLPEHKELVKLTALSDSAHPTHFEFPTKIKKLDKVWYNVSTSGGNEYREISYVDPLDFLTLTDNQTTNTTLVYDKNGNTAMFIRNDKMPTYYTSFDDKYIVMDSHNSAVDSTLQQSKTRAYTVKYPTFVLADTHVVDIDEALTNHLLLEALSLYQDLYKGGVTSKVNQLATRSRNRTNNDQSHSPTKHKRNRFGRHKGRL